MEDENHWGSSRFGCRKWQIGMCSMYLYSSEFFSSHKSFLGPSKFAFDRQYASVIMSAQCRYIWHISNAIPTSVYWPTHSFIGRGLSVIVVLNRLRCRLAPFSANQIPVASMYCAVNHVSHVTKPQLRDAPQSLVRLYHGAMW